MKGIILAGGTGSRLMPITKVLNKQLLPVYDKPMIYYPLCTLMELGIVDILIISNRKSLPFYKELLGNGKKYGINLQYEHQAEPRGLAEAFIIGESFIGNDNVTLILGDNIFYGNNLTNEINVISKNFNGGIVFGYEVSNPSDYGVVSFNENGYVNSIVEKPENPQSNFAVPGLYIYDNSVVQRAKNLNYSQRNELEITDLNNNYLEDGILKVRILPKGSVWFDTGTYATYSSACEFIRVVQERQKILIGSVEETAFNLNLINEFQLKELAKENSASDYGAYLKKLKK
jgi:glucose-1-phosphate thymidylyltransferase